MKEEWKSALTEHGGVSAPRLLDLGETPGILVMQESSVGSLDI